MRANTWAENFFSRVVVKCKTDFCDTLVETTRASAARSGGVYCDACRKEAKRIHNRNYDTGVRNRRRREATRKAAAVPRECAVPGCGETFTGAPQRKYCDAHLTTRSRRTAA